MTDTHPHRDEILELLRRADCHYGNTLRDEDEGLSIAEAAAWRDDVKHSRIVDLRRAVHQVAEGERSRVKKWAEHEEAVLRALLHFDADMTPELRSYVYTRVPAVQSQFGLPVTTEKLACRTRGAHARRSRVADPSDEQFPEPATATDADPAPEAPAAEDDEGELGYATAEELRQVDDLAMKLALKEAAGRWPAATIERMPHNNPGYDIEVRHAAGGLHFVEVKGTRSPEPGFFITAREVAHSQAHPEKYSIWIFHGMDLKAGTAALTAHDGPVTDAHFELVPFQFRGRFTGAR